MNSLSKTTTQPEWVYKMNEVKKRWITTTRWTLQYTDLLIVKLQLNQVNIDPSKGAKNLEEIKKSFYLIYDVILQWMLVDHVSLTLKFSIM